MDNIICVSECGYKSVMLNYFLICKTSTKKLQFGASKCKKCTLEENKKTLNVTQYLLIIGKRVMLELIEDIFVGKVIME